MLRIHHINAIKILRLFNIAILCRILLLSGISLSLSPLYASPLSSLNKNGSDQKPVLEKISFQKTQNMLEVEILCTKYTGHSEFQLKEPNRIVVDFSNIDDIQCSRLIQINDFGISTIRAGMFKSDVARVVFDLESEIPPFQIEKYQEGVKFSFLRKQEIVDREEIPTIKEKQEEEKAIPVPAPEKKEISNIEQEDKGLLTQPIEAPKDLEISRREKTLVRFNKILQPVITVVLNILIILLLAISLLFIGSFLIHNRKKRFIVRRKYYWQNIINGLLSGEKSPDSISLTHKERKYFRDELISEYLEQDTPSRKKIKDLYRQISFYEEDIRHLKAHSWWKKIQAIERLESLELAEAEDDVFSLFKNRRYEVRLSALKMLASIKSQKLLTNLPEIFAEESRWEYQYIINILISAEISVDDLRPLAESPSRDLRKAAAVILGRQGNKEAIPVLRVLSSDEEKDVRREAVLSLGKIASIQSLPFLIDRIDDNNPQVRAAVAKSIGELGIWREDLSIPFFLDFLANDPHYEVRFEAFYSLSRFGDRGKKLFKRLMAKFPELGGEYVS